MKRIFLLSTIILLTSLTAMAQKPQQRKFDPEKFKQEMVNYVVREAKLTQQETSAFVPVYKEMLENQRRIFDQMKAIDRCNPQTDSECRDKIKQRDKLDIELKKQQQSYHSRMMTIISPSKMFKVMKAEDSFHRKMLRRGNERKDNNRNQNKGK